MSAPAGDPAEFWEGFYAAADRVWTGRVNAALADVAAGLPPGRALDLGCGEGGDAIWLAGRGWRVTGVDVSATAVARGRAAARAAGLPDDAVDLVVADLATWAPQGSFDLVTASFLQSPVDLPRAVVLRRAAGWVAPGGHLLVVGHAGPPSWAGPEHATAHAFADPAGDLADLAPDPAGWSVEVAEVRERAVTAPDGTAGTVPDGVLLLSRR